eukprot:1195342-Prorocentrum_minimum.AAC.2
MRGSGGGQDGVRRWSGGGFPVQIIEALKSGYCRQALKGTPLSGDVLAQTFPDSKYIKKHCPNAPAMHSNWNEFRDRIAAALPELEKVLPPLPHRR